MITCWLITGERQATVCRKKYFSALLKQEIGWFDCINQSELSTNFSADTVTFQGALGEKVAVMIQVVGTFIGGFIIAFTTGWLMTLVCLAGIPVIAYSGFLYKQALQQKSKEFQRIYAEAGGFAEQAIYSIKTVKQMNG
jgi:ATP-binding cassette subfamily B (MDR/TAP) protein 1